MHDAISVEDLHRPAVVLANEGFVTDGRSAASNKGMPVVRIVPETVPCECSIKEHAETGIGGVMDQILEALVNPLTAEEASPKRKEAEQASRIVFKGDLGEVNRFFYKRGWGDGMPLMPPTEEAVREMLTGTDLTADHVVGKIEPRYGKATVEKIAVNAVMAGALPTYMPILIAGVEALTEQLAQLGSYGTSTGSWTPFWIINGAIRNDARVNCSSGAMSPGDIANATIGRAMGLIIKNVGGARKAVEDMGVYGNPGRYSSVIGENEEQSPWEPLHVEDGLGRDESAVTLFFPNCYSQIWQYGSDDRGILNTFIYNLQPGRGGLCCLIMTPHHARTLAEKGWTKPMIRKFVSEFGRVPAYRHPSFHQGGGWTVNRPETVAPGPMDTVAIIPNPSLIKILVAGGPGAFLGLACGSGMVGADFVTKKIRLPANWSKLVAKYKNLVPAYEKY
ncbi:MAG: hypothetical protein A3H32_12915 [Betaproteobacteria bacterium RIFCSPLOWO2_02_FULL_63_19]|nr:MAG: hypothetical protein A3H32_12915 [Betaproteobacteria bacterium RIFCSPLOWO2_02_FULL_63_19]